MSAKRFIDKGSNNNQVVGLDEKHLFKALSIAHVGSWEIDLSTSMMRGSDEALRIYGLNSDDGVLPLKMIQSIPLPEYRAALDEAVIAVEPIEDFE